MKTFYSAADIEQLASQGVRELAVDDDTVLTTVAREVAAQLGIRLVTPEQRPSAGAAVPVLAAATPLKPRGCQHGAAKSAPSPTGTSGTNSQVVDDLIGAVRQLAKRG